ncbi:MAG: DUF4304 domain-containing protein [Anaerolineaceae bacterium]|nr:DUF4304 domain-containing protein [Anaerolineaceae bacterium]
MNKTYFAKKTDQIQTHVHNYLKGLGFRKRNRTFNKVHDSGLVHVINFQLGKSWSSLNGFFTVNIGVFIPEVHGVITGHEVPKFISEYDCEIRERLGSLMNQSRIERWMNRTRKDIWWNLALNVDDLSETVLDTIQKHGLPYLDQFLTLDNIIKKWKKHGQSIGLPPRAGLSIAIMLASQGDMNQAKQILQKEYDKPYSLFVNEIAQKIGITDFD